MIEEKGYYLVVGMAASWATVVEAVVVMAAVVVKAFNGVVGRMAVGGKLIDILEVVGAVVEVVGDVAVSLIVHYFGWRRLEQCRNGTPSLVVVRRSRILWKIDLKHQIDLRRTGR